MEMSGDRVYDNITFKPSAEEEGVDKHVNCGNPDIRDTATVIPSTGQGAVSERSLYKPAAACLGVLCVLLLAWITALGVFYANTTVERDDLKRRLSEVTCPDGWVKFGCRCYYVSTEKKNWAASRQDCRGRGADLVIINSLEEQLFLNNLTKGAWIGMTDTVTEGTWIWVDGTPLTSPLFWLPGIPDNYWRKFSSDCGIFSTLPWATPPLTWNDISCNYTTSWVCERADG
ncbi:C-type lectin domain family 4 member E-like [Osmerus mordax]|uniref:C-type lectin domain family 4 member E-like n=1 Tax=Osmerus mordax TaxID=8014 RepID=UPI00350FC743